LRYVGWYIGTWYVSTVAIWYVGTGGLWYLIQYTLMPGGNT
jgi:hypothetical protein